MDDPQVIAAISSLNSVYNRNEDESKRIIASKDDHVFIWNHADSSILAVYLNKEVNETNLCEGRIQTFQITDTPTFDVDTVLPSPTGRWLCLWGRRGVTCVELPRRAGKSGRYANGQRTVMCRSFSVAERFFVLQAKISVLQVEFHPGSGYDDHLVVLASDNYFRIYNLDADRQTPEQSINLNPGSHSKSASFFATSALSIKASLGESAVSFAFAPPAVEEGLVGSSIWPMFVLYGNGDVYCLVTGLGEFKPDFSPLSGPLSMYPEAPDNYGAESCSILCLHPMISSPPLLVIATNAGILYHCVVLNSAASVDDQEDLRSQISQWSTSSLAREPQISLYVYESVELDLGLTSNSERAFDHPINLHVDPTTPARYFCSHKSGVHCVGLPMVTQLAELSQNVGNTKPILDRESIVEHLICTRVCSSASPAPVMGVAVHYPPPTLTCLLSNFGTQNLPLSSPYFSAPPPLLSENEKATSPLKSRSQSKEPFDDKIRMMLKKSTTLPTMRAGPNAKLDSQECLDLLTRSMQVLREEYLARLESARVEIERKVVALTAQRVSQSKSINSIYKEKHELREKAADLSEKYEDLKDSGERLQSRVEIVLQKIQSRLPVSSDAEIRMQRQLSELQRRTKDLANAMEQIKTKEKYQTRQTEVTRKNLVDSANRRIATDSSMGENQLNSIKDILKEDSEEITALVKSLNMAKKDLAV